MAGHTQDLSPFGERERDIKYLILSYKTAL